MRIFISITAVILFGVLTADSVAQQQEPLVIRAMKDELHRNIERLSLEGVSAPFFISYTVKDVHNLQIRSTFGALTVVDTTHRRMHDVRVLVGDHAQTQEHFVGGDFSLSFDDFSQTLTLEDDYDAIRRELWLSTDRAYKNATEALEKKRAALRQQQVPEDYKDVADFANADPVVSISPPVTTPCDVTAAEDRVKRLSALFASYPQIHDSRVQFSLQDMMLYFVNSEGTVIAEPRRLAVLLAVAATQAENGEPLTDFVVHYAVVPSELPDEETLADEIHQMAAALVDRRSAPVMEDTYTGPVLFLDQAVPELFTRLYLGKEGLFASRMPIMAGPMAMMAAQMQKRNLGDKLGKRVLPKGCTIRSVPTTAEFDGRQLPGAYTIDAEGVRPSDELLLVENGRVASLLSNRTPTPHSKASTGHQCIGIGMASTNGIGPGVLDIQMQEGPDASEMKELLIEYARDEGLDFAYIVRRILPATVPELSIDDDLTTRISMFGMSGGAGAEPLGQLTRMYRVDVSDGSETLVRSVEMLKPGSSALRRLEASSDRDVWNTTIDGESPVPGFGAFISIGRSVAGVSGGVPVSIIAPKAVLIEDMEVRQEKRPITPRPPIVASPLAD